jgi:trehalose 6-phosphate synthase
MIRSLRLSLRFLLPLLLAILAVAYLSVPLVDSLMQRWFVRDLDIRSTFIARSFEEPVGDLLESNAHARIDALLERATVDERLFALALCDANGRLIQKTRSFPASIDCSVRRSGRDGAGLLLESPRGPLHVSTADLKRSDAVFATLVMLHDMSFVQRRSEDTRKYILLLFTGLGLVVALITIAVAHVSWRGWIAGVLAMLSGDGVIRPF